MHTIGNDVMVRSGLGRGNVRRPAPLQSRVAAAPSLSQPVPKPAMAKSAIGNVMAQAALYLTTYFEPVENYMAVPKRHPWKAVYISLSAVVVLAAGGYVGFTWWHNNQLAVVQAAALPADTTPGLAVPIGNPSETKPDIAGYKVAADKPRWLQIPSLNADARIVPVGIKGDDDVAVTNNIYDTGWFSGSAKPGERGAMLINGFENGLTQLGTFTGLKKLAKGDKIVVERGDGKLFTYEVAKTITYSADEVDIAQVLSPIDVYKPGLTLLTNATQVDNAHNGDRLAIFAELKN